jgi:hypothetical protein
VPTVTRYGTTAPPIVTVSSFVDDASATMAMGFGGVAAGGSCGTGAARATSPQARRSRGSGNSIARA